mmetsp:Transcript_3699/g.12401  ORF Transcript_3699/g.12401 Transcript_3699/m.12401 type:complete len:229 (-) Transcript_3699:785-1471(-)
MRHLSAEDVPDDDFLLFFFPPLLIFEDAIRVSKQATSPSSLETKNSSGFLALQHTDSQSAPTLKSKLASFGARTSHTLACLSKPPETRTVLSSGFHSKHCTLEVCFVKVSVHVSVETSHIFTVLSALADANTFRNCEFHDMPKTASWCPSFFTLGLLFPPLELFFTSAVSYPPKVAAGSTASMQSKSQISIPGYIVPTAQYEPRLFAPVSLQQSIHAKHNGNAGNITS